MSIFASNSVRQTFWFGNLSANLESRNFSEFSKTELILNADKTKIEHKNSGKLEFWDSVSWVKGCLGIFPKVVRIFFSDFSDFLHYFSTFKYFKFLEKIEIDLVSTRFSPRLLTRFSYLSREKTAKTVDQWKQQKSDAKRYLTEFYVKSGKRKNYFNFLENSAL